MADTYKAGKRFWRRAKRGAREVGELQYRRAAWGSTEKIRRRHRGLWSRLAGKARRRLDREAVADGV